MRRINEYRNKDVYSKLFNIAEMNMEAIGSKLPMSKDVFNVLMDANMDGCLDVKTLECMSVEDKVTALYVYLLKRLPKQAEIVRKSREKNCSKLVTGILLSPEFAKKNTSCAVYNMVHENALLKLPFTIRYRMTSLLYRSLKRTYGALPLSFKDYLRRKGIVELCKRFI